MNAEIVCCSWIDRGDLQVALKAGQGNEGTKQIIAENRNFSENVLRQLRTHRESHFATPESGWFNGLNGFQYIMTPNAQSWQDSRKICEDMGGDLAAEGFRDELRIAISNYFYNSSTVSCWIGLSDLEEKGNFKWVDGVVSTPQNTFWSTEHPEDEELNGNCVEMFIKQPLQFTNTLYNDVQCATSYKAFCSKPLALKGKGSVRNGP